VTARTKLELTWIGKENRPRLEPRILIEDPSRSHHAAYRVTGHDVFDNRLIFGDNLLALKALEQECAGKVKCVYIDPPFNTKQAFEHYDDGLEGYNADDCISTLRLRDWLEAQRASLLADGVDIPRPAPKEAEPPEGLNQREQRVATLREQLLAGAPVEESERTPEQWSRCRKRISSTSRAPLPVLSVSNAWSWS